MVLEQAILPALQGGNIYVQVHSRNNCPYFYTVLLLQPGTKCDKLSIDGVFVRMVLIALVLRTTIALPVWRGAPVFLGHAPFRNRLRTSSSVY
jgi:hypothetical protein